MKEKTPLSHKVVCFQMLDFETSNSKSEVSKSNSMKITSFSKTSSLRREPFLTMFYTINLSPLLVTILHPCRYQVRFCANNFFEKVPIVSTALKHIKLFHKSEQQLVFEYFDLCWNTSLILGTCRNYVHSNDCLHQVDNSWEQTTSSYQTDYLLQ